MTSGLTAGAGRATYQALLNRVRELEAKLAQASDVITTMTYWASGDPGNGSFPLDLQAELDERKLNWCGPCMGQCENLDKYCYNHNLRWSKCAECRCDENDFHTNGSIKIYWELGGCVFCGKSPCLYREALCHKHNQPLKHCWECFLASENCHHDSTPNDVFTMPDATATAKRKAESEAETDAKCKIVVDANTATTATTATTTDSGGDAAEKQTPQ